MATGTEKDHLEEALKGDREKGVCLLGVTADPMWSQGRELEVTPRMSLDGFGDVAVTAG